MRLNIAFEVSVICIFLFSKPLIAVFQCFFALAATFMRLCFVHLKLDGIVEYK